MIDEQQAARVRRMLGQRRGSGGRRRYSEEGSKAAAALGHGARRSGVAVTTTAAALGILPDTLFRWMRAWPESPPAFAAVVRIESPTSPPVATQTEWVVHHPSGARVTGLGVDDVAALLRRLG